MADPEMRMLRPSVNVPWRARQHKGLLSLSLTLDNKFMYVAGVCHALWPGVIKLSLDTVRQPTMEDRPRVVSANCE